MKKKMINKNIKKIIISGIIIVIGLTIFKLIPMEIWGMKILFDASAHIAIAIFLLYITWFFIDQNKSWRIPYFIFCFLVLAIISMQRIITQNHNDLGLLEGLIIGIIAIGIAEWKSLKNKLKF